MVEARESTPHPQRSFETSDEIQKIVDSQPSSIILIPYTSRIAGVAVAERRKGSASNREARIRLSAYSAFVTKAAELLGSFGASDQYIATGENSFGSKYPSTAELMRDQLSDDGVDSQRIMVLGGLQDTDQQFQGMKTLTSEKPELMRNPVYIAMDFHKKRVERKRNDNHLPGTVVSAEGIFMEYFRRKYTQLQTENQDQYRLELRARAIDPYDPEAYDKLIEHHRHQLDTFTTPEIFRAERLFQSLTSLGFVGDLALKPLRAVRGQTVTDRHSLETARAHEKKARKFIKEGELQPGDFNT